MPIRLNDTAKVREYVPQAGVLIRYRVAKSGEVISSIRAIMVNGQVDGVAVEASLVASHIVSWTGIEDSNGVAIDWPSDAAAQLMVLDALPWELVTNLRGLIVSTQREAAESGKG